MRKILCFTAASVLAVSLASGAHAAAPLSEVALGPVVGTSGVGLQVSAPLWPKYLNITSGFTALGLSHGVSAGGIKYNGKLNLGGVPVYLSVFPFGGNFHLDGGMFINNNRMSVSATPSFDETFVINGHSYSTSELGSLDGATHYNKVAPYVGIGWGDPFLGGRLTFTANAGVILEGGANITLSSPGAANVPGAAADIATEQAKLNKEVKFLQFWPVVNVGVVYRF